MTTTASDLPFELIQEILTISAESSLKQAATLSRVSRSVYELTKPVLFRTFVYWDDETVLPGETDTEWLNSYGKYARDLLWGTDSLRIVPVLKCCPNVTNIAIWIDPENADFPLLLELLSQHRPHRLSIDLNILFGGPFQEKHALLPMFINMTHLEPISNNFPDWDLIEGIQHLPKLTHLALLHTLNMNSVVQNALTQCKHLAFLVLSSLWGPRRYDPEAEIVFEGPRDFSIQGGDDPRVVFIRSYYVEEWHLSSKGGKGMWVLAEEVVNGRTGKL
ncbi:hypothetical protein BDN72DRAFT_961410 [Pluteus cervinus]|uniref:Uncharacterized protein n=1 Tax=Pluteus cervinus TaxID=181527 RepID=A0ACD3AMP6_9AGAR|nr:hypothetical protein BDN72DRAFT_961410 [Pluteus cervinus]